MNSERFTGRGFLKRVGLTVVLLAEAGCSQIGFLSPVSTTGPDGTVTPKARSTETQTPASTTTSTHTATFTPTATETATLTPTETEHFTTPKILLLGDSMIAATYVPTDLSTLLKNAGIPVNFVGDKMDAGNHIPVDGFSGFDTATMLHQLQSTSWNAGGLTYPNTFAVHVPDIVIIQLGTNDLGTFKDPVAEYESDMTNIIQFLRFKNPRMEIIVSKLIPSRNITSDEKIKRINDAIPDFVQSMNSQDSPVVTTRDLRGEWQPKDFADDYHPGITGSEKMAGADFDALVGNRFVTVGIQAIH